ncbi:MAG: hypothetical protein Ct9H300mP17_08650 [Candidatus Nitrosopelagicus sp.]|nr:MAG: hypothetical protein Ct9H300mP17_08650 [Candidatus Nitrosopelagicus sp.]
MLLLVDNGSVFTKDIANTLSNSGIKFDQKPSDQINLDDISDYVSLSFCQVDEIMIHK